MLKVATVLPHEPYREYKDVERVYSGSTEIDKILDKNGNVLFAVNKEVEGTPALTYKGKEETNLKNYRIYGQTVDGESVGDRTGNLFDGSFIHRSVSGTIVGDDDPNRRSIVIDISNFNNGDKITFSRETGAGNNFQMYQVTSPLKGGALFNDNVFTGEPNTLLATITLDDIANYHYLMIYLNGALNPITDEELLASKIMVNVGNTALPYEPYGYKVPVTVEGKNLLPNNGTSYTTPIITATKNDDGSVTISNHGEERTQVTWVYYNSVDVLFKAGTQIIISTRYTAGISFKYSDNTWSGSISQNQVYTIPKDVIMAYSQFDINADEIHTLYPMIRKADIENDTYEPYHAPVTTPIYLPEQIKMVGDEAEYVDYKEQKQYRVRKNLLPNTATSQTINGVTFTVNNDGGVTCNGTVSEEIPIGVNALFFVSNITLPAGKYILSGCPAGGNEKTTFKQLIYANGVWLENDKGSGANFILTDAGKVSVRIVIYSGYTCDNLTFYPMIRKADIEDDTYEPYIENTDLDVTLPALPTLTGTNTLTVGTEVQPSNVYLKGRIKEVS